ncbi:MAG: threonine synthase [Candidatus Tectomicrobia bacterium]|nr:threonine synthase [Candidatus Tectomicrobia bacterium]
MGYVQGLRCRECGRAYEKLPQHVCEFCFGPLECLYDYDAIRARVSRASIEAGPPSMWRYRDLLPLDGEPTVGLHVGMTPLVHAKNLGEVLGLTNLWLKNDSVSNPTLSFKDRVVAVAVSKAREFGFDTVACASTGNLANSLAAHAAEARMRSYIFIPADIESGKVVSTLVYGAQLVGVRGNYDEVNRLCSEISDHYHWAFVNINIRPYYGDGSKTFIYEVIEQLGWRAPDHIVVPVAGSSLITKVAKGLKEFEMLGLIENAKTKIYAAQASGCAPVTTAIKNGEDFIRPVKPNTIAKSIAIGNPADGYYGIQVCRDSGGYGDDVCDDDIRASMRLLAETEGIFTETAGGVTIGVLRKLVEQGRIGRDELAVASITGNGLKTQEAVASLLPDRIDIDTTLTSFREAYAQMNA